jgi:hypothetical protein
MKFYAAQNKLGFANSWEVFVFSNKKDRDDYVKMTDGYCPVLQRVVDCKAIKKDVITCYAANYSMSQNRVLKPRPFTNECWMYSDDLCDEGTKGLIGKVFVGYPEYDSGEKLF